MRVYRSACPCNCYDACAMLTYVEDGRVVKVEGDPGHGYTRGRLCAKGYAYSRRVHSPERLRYPLRQFPRGSGNWQRLSWEEALDLIACSILELKARYGSTLPLAYNKYSGNFGWLQNTVDAFFTSLGPTTRAGGSPCWAAGLDAMYLDFGTIYNPDPEDLASCRAVILWGANPAWTSVHSLALLQQARERGGIVAVIDPVLSATARWADYYFQVKPGTDGALALGVLAYLYRQGHLEIETIARYATGWPDLEAYLQGLSPEWAAAATGLPPEAIATLATIYAKYLPAATWIGFGLQRHANGGQNVRAINALATLAGLQDGPGGGIYYAHQATWPVEPPLAMPPDARGSNRYLNINNFAAELVSCREPPVKFLWLAYRDPVTQEAGARQLIRALDTLEMIVVVDHFLTPAAQVADIVLPAASLFETWDIVSSYWHYWVAANEPALPPWFEARSDLEIVAALAARLNELAPGSSTFPVGRQATTWLDILFDQRLQDLLGLKSWQGLLEGPRKARVPAPPSGITLRATGAGEAALPVLPVYVPPLAPPPEYPLQLLTSHQQFGLHSQFQNLDWLQALNPEPAIFLSPVAARKRRLADGDLARVYNENGEIIARVRIEAGVQEGVAVAYEGWYGKDRYQGKRLFSAGDYNVNFLTSPRATDMGNLTTGFPGCAFYDCFVEVCRL
ncbi:putative dimethyl sulfoxide reductase chain YnfF precursor [Moorella thermoacetica]|uniref:Putative dimethyl sulfoxide reductase chain YnfF n=1 Tax=Neomoorella thermoacetica TaxID=1525 RepID=A0A1J5P121_NEOTH|nr:putative dimethyl sulfoxide reductase chain YnfF precursor [Moorella thermoacetica]